MANKLTGELSATVRTCANIALAKYWGKSDVALNLPAVPSISMTLSPMFTTTTVTFVPGLAADELILGGKAALPKETARATALLNRIRERSGVTLNARVESENEFPTASGLASSASGFAALAAAATLASGLELDMQQASADARQASASAARSLFGGYVELPAGVPGDAKLAATQLAPSSHWDLRIVVGVTAEGRKAVLSTDGMTHTRDTSPYYAAWVAAAPAIADRVREGILARELSVVGPAMEHSTLSFHACAMAAAPGVIYMQPATLAALATVRRLRDEDNISVWATMDAGPHVKALCAAADAERVTQALLSTPGVLRTILASPGPGVEIL